MMSYATVLFLSPQKELDNLEFFSAPVVESFPEVADKYLRIVKEPWIFVQSRKSACLIMIVLQSYRKILSLHFVTAANSMEKGQTIVIILCKYSLPVNN